jgi:hypothetical protein
MSQQNARVTVVDVDIAKNSFHIVGQDGTRGDCSAAKVVAQPG